MSSDITGQPTFGRLVGWMWIYVYDVFLSEVKYTKWSRKLLFTSGGRDMGRCLYAHHITPSCGKKGRFRLLQCMHVEY